MSLQSLIPAVVTPFDQKGRIDFRSFEKILLKQIEADVSGIVIFGTTGECPTLTFEEKREILRFTVKTVANRTKIIANVGTNSTNESILLAQIAKEEKADYLLAIVPYYNKPQKEGIIRHFYSIADVGLPLIFYHHPGRTGICLSFESIQELSMHPAIYGIKECSSDLDLIKKIKTDLPNLKVFSGNDDELLEQIKLGIDGVISVVGQLLPKPFIDLFEKNELKEYEELLPLIKTIFREVNPQGIKAALQIVGFQSMELRLPLVPVSNETYKAIEKEIKLLAEKSVALSF